MRIVLKYFFYIFIIILFYRKHIPSQEQINLDFRTIDKNWSAMPQNGSKTILSPTDHSRYSVNDFEYQERAKYWEAGSF